MLFVIPPKQNVIEIRLVLVLKSKMRVGSGLGKIMKNGVRSGSVDLGNRKLPSILTPALLKTGQFWRLNKVKVKNQSIMCNVCSENTIDIPELDSIRLRSL